MFVEGFDNTQAMASTAVAMISNIYIYQMVMAELKSASLVCAAAEFTEFFNPVIKA